MTIRQTHRPHITLWPNGQKGDKIDLGPACIAFQCEKSIQQPIGRWSTTILPLQGTQGPAALRNLPDLERQIRPNGVISIGYDEPGGIMFGLVDSWRRTRSFGSQTAYNLTITGSDFGKTLARDHIVHATLTVNDLPEFLSKVGAVTGPNHALLEALPGVWGPIGRDATPTFLGASVEDVVEWLLTTAPAMAVPLLANTGGSGRPGEFINFADTVTVWNDGRVWSEAPHTYQGTVWDFIRRILDEDFYEVWLDTTPTGNAIPEINLIIRPKPFDEPGMKFLPTQEDLGIDWPNLKTRIDGLSDHEIREAELFSEELGFTDADVYAYYQVTSAHALIGNPDGLKEGLFYPAVDTFALKNTGLRAYEATLSLLSADVARKQAGELDYDREVGFEVVEFRNRLLNWYRMNEYMIAGSMTVPGRDRFRVGDPVLRPGLQGSRFGTFKGMRFYTTGTSHRWAVNQPYTTTLRVMRGHNQSVIDLFEFDVGVDALRTPGADIQHIASVS